MLPLLSAETVFHKPFSYKFFGKLSGRQALREILFIIFCVEIAGRIGCMDFINQANLVTQFPEFVFSIDKDEAFSGSNLLSAGKQSQGVFLELFVILPANQTCRDNLILGNVLVVCTNLGFGGGGYYWFFKCLVFTHAFRERYAAQCAGSTFIGAPRTSGKVSAYDHLHRKRFAFVPDSDHWMGRGNFPVWDNIGCVVQKPGGDLI